MSLKRGCGQDTEKVGMARERGRTESRASLKGFTGASSTRQSKLNLPFWNDGRSWEFSQRKRHVATVHQMTVGLWGVRVSGERGNSSQVSALASLVNEPLKPLFWAIFSRMFVASSLGRERWCLHPKQRAGKRISNMTDWESQSLTGNSMHCMSNVPFILSCEKWGLGNWPPRCWYFGFVHCFEKQTISLYPNLRPAQ